MRFFFKQFVLTGPWGAIYAMMGLSKGSLK